MKLSIISFVIMMTLGSWLPVQQMKLKEVFYLKGKQVYTAKGFKNIDEYWQYPVNITFNHNKKITYDSLHINFYPVK